MLAALVLVACGGPPQGGAPPAGPRTGRILFHQAAREKDPAFSKSYRLTEEGAPETDYTHVLYGEVHGRPPAEDFVKKLFDRSAGLRSEIPVSPAQFAELLRRLEEAGLSTLSRSSGIEPPQEKDFLLIEVDGARDVYTKPPSSSASAGADTPEGKRLRAWRATVRVMLAELPRVTSR